MTALFLRMKKRRRNEELERRQMKTSKLKMTELGPIPADWEVKRLGDLFELSAAGDLQSECSSRVKTDINIHPIYSNGLENAGLYGYTSKPRYRANSITITGRGTLGHAEYRTVDFDAIIRLIVMRPSEMLDGRYVAFQINYLNPFHFEITSIPQLTVPQVVQALIPVPPLPEQEKIAEALSDVDALLSAMTTLIEKKRAIKQGAMQEMLGMRNDGSGMRNVPRRRLAGFSGEWVEKRLGEIGDFIAGNGFPLSKQGDKSGDYPFFKVSDFNNIGNENVLCVANNYISESTFSELHCSLIPSGSIVFAKIGAAIALERKRRVCYDSCIDNNMMAFCVNRQNDERFITECLRRVVFADLAESTALPALNVSKLREYKIVIPKSILEQQAIAAVLSDMDAEIAALEAKRAKYESIKQGMMQELLTGRTRLKGK